MKLLFSSANNISALATLASWPQLHSFSIGLENSPDLLAARKAAHYLGTVHHEYVFTVQEGLDAIPEVIHHLETYDVTTVRASTPMYLLSRKIKAMGVKMVLSGEGSDEIFGGNGFFWQFCGHSTYWHPSSTRLSLLPRCSGSHIISPRMRPSRKKSSYLWLPSGKQVRLIYLFFKKDIILKEKFKDLRWHGV